MNALKSSRQVTLRVWGDFACFTRPEMKVERVSYPVMTPSAARGILEAIFWEPQMYYLIDSIRIIKRGQWISFRRNEVTSVVSLENVKSWMKNPSKFKPILAGGGAKDGTQRNMLALQDVEYLITAEVCLTQIDRNSQNKLGKYLAEIERRARSGKCYHRPSFGVREFAADFEWEPDADEAELRRAAQLKQAPGALNEELGLVLYDVFDHRERAIGFRWLKNGEISTIDPVVVDKRAIGQHINPSPTFFMAKIESSKLDCHPERIQIITQKD